MPQTPERKKEYMAEYMRKRYAADPEFRGKVKARSLARNAIRDGRLTKKPCHRCGSRKTQVHHDDYSKPLEVKWVCRRCHVKEHGSKNFGGTEGYYRRLAPSAVLSRLTPC